MVAGGGSSFYCCSGCIVCRHSSTTLLQLQWAASVALAEVQGTAAGNSTIRIGNSEAHCLGAGKAPMRSNRERHDNKKHFVEGRRGMARRNKMRRPKGGAPLRGAAWMNTPLWSSSSESPSNLPLCHDLCPCLLLSSLDTSGPRATHLTEYVSPLTSISTCRDCTTG